MIKQVKKNVQSATQQNQIVIKNFQVLLQSQKTRVPGFILPGSHVFQRLARQCNYLVLKNIGNA
jgi:hypothetical protein